MSKACDSGLSSPALPSAALMPPSAAPEWLRVGWSFETIATSAPASWASIAARIPAQPGTDHENVVRRLHVQGSYTKRPPARGGTVGVRSAMIRPPDPPLTDGVVSLRPWRKDDVAVLPGLIDGDPEIERWLELMPSPYTKQDAREWVARTSEAWRTGLVPAVRRPGRGDGQTWSAASASTRSTLDDRLGRDRLLADRVGARTRASRRARSGSSPAGASRRWGSSGCRCGRRSRTRRRAASPSGPASSARA